MILNKRLSYLVTTGLYTSSLVLLYVFNLVSYRGSVLVAFVLFALAAYYISFNQIKKIRYIMLLSFVTISFLYFFQSLNLVSIVLYIIFVSLGIYLNLLALNIYNISEKIEKTLPLLQAAKLVLFIAVILIVFLSSTMVYKIYFVLFGSLGSMGLQLILFTFLYSYLFYSIMDWFFYEDKVGESKARNTLMSLGSLRLFSILYMTELSLVLMFTRLEDFGRGLFLAANMYVLVGFIQVVINRTLNRRFFIESLSILFLIYLIIYYL